MQGDTHIRAEKLGALGLFTLVRPAALNALTRGMVQALDSQLRAWERDDTVKTLAIRGEGRAFCAGGDIRAVQQSVQAGTAEGAALLQDEYRLNARIGALKKPWVALLHGYVFGGGAGVSVHGGWRLGDAGMTFAMPETAIGFVPDVGASHFLSRCPGEMGMYLALTGLAIERDDAVAAGLVTHAVEASDFDAVIARLADGAAPDEAMRGLTGKPAAGPLAEHRGRIATVFAASSVEAVLERLDRDGSDFARTTAQIIRGRSPTSLKLAFRQIREGRALTLPQCLAMEYRLATRVIMDHDFGEGVRAALIDKDRNPRWSPSSLAAVTPDRIDAFFAPGVELFSH